MMMHIKEILLKNSIRMNISIGLTALQKQREKGENDMKKLLALLLVFAMMFSFAACGKDGDDSAENADDTIETTAEDVIAEATKE